MDERRPMAFLSYAHFADSFDNGYLTKFGLRLSGEVRLQWGDEFLIFQDRKDISWGDCWKSRIKCSLDTTTFLIPVITPGFFKSEYCRDELSRFLEREKKLGRDDLILPVYYIDMPVLNDKKLLEVDELTKIIASRQYADWRNLRFEDLNSKDARKAISGLAAQICKALYRLDIFQTPETDSNPSIKSSIESLEQFRDATEPNAIAVDQMNRRNTHKLNDTGIQSLEEPSLQNHAFWNIFPFEYPIRVFVGALHNSENNREMVGDWDFRTAMELFSYLSLIEKNAKIESIALRFQPNRFQDFGPDKCSNNFNIIEYMKGFCDMLSMQLTDANAIIIGSSDVNPVTEYLLYDIYNVLNSEGPFLYNDNEKFNGFVTIKSIKTYNDDIDHGFSSLFYREIPLKEGEQFYRGFQYHSGHLLSNIQHFEDYYGYGHGQGQVTNQRFTVLGHIVIAQNPRSKKNFVVMLNGFSGPATYALAEILTGGGRSSSNKKRLKSQMMLKDINEKLKEAKGNGIEAIVKVRVEMPDSNNFLNSDNRIIVDWDFLENYGPREIIKWI